MPSNPTKSQRRSSLSCCQLMACSLLLLVLLPGKAESKPFKITDLLPGLVDEVIGGIYAEGDIDLLGHPCQYKRIPYIKSWELHYKAEVRCLGWTPIVGEARDRRNPTHAEQEAIKDFVRKALDKGLITQEEANEWL